MNHPSVRMPNGFVPHPDGHQTDSSQQHQHQQSTLDLDKFLSPNDARRGSGQLNLADNRAATAGQLDCDYAPAGLSGPEGASNGTSLFVPDCCQDSRIESSLSKSHDTNEEVNDEHLYGGGAHASPVSNTAFSLEEPRSMSTFMAPTLGGNDILMGPTMSSKLQNAHHNHEDDECGEPMRKLSFGRGLGFDEQLLEIKASSRQRRLRKRASRHRSLVNLSESTTAATVDDLDETSYMPTWVKNEYIDNQLGARGHRPSLQYDMIESSRRLQRAEDASSFVTNSTSSTEQTCLAELSSTEPESTITRGTIRGDSCDRLPTGNCILSEARSLSSSSSSSLFDDDLNETGDNEQQVNDDCAGLSSSSCCSVESNLAKQNGSFKELNNSISFPQAHQVPKQDLCTSSSTIKSRSSTAIGDQIGPALDLCKRLTNESETRNSGARIQQPSLSRSQPELGEAQGSIAATNATSSRPRASSQTSKTGPVGGNLDDNILLCDNIINCGVYRPQIRPISEQPQGQASWLAHNVKPELASCSNQYQINACSSPTQGSSTQSSAASRLNKVPQHLVALNNTLASTMNGSTSDQATVVAGIGQSNETRRILSDRISSSCMDVREPQASVVTMIEANHIGYAGDGGHSEMTSDLSDQVTKLSRSIRSVSRKLRHNKGLAFDAGSGISRSSSLSYFRGKAAGAGSCTSLSSIRKSVMRIFC